jgi:hypothetical protein
MIGHMLPRALCQHTAGRIFCYTMLQPAHVLVSGRLPWACAFRAELSAICRVPAEKNGRKRENGWLMIAPPQSGLTNVTNVTMAVINVTDVTMAAMNVTNVTMAPINVTMTHQCNLFMVLCALRAHKMNF